MSKSGQTHAERSCGYRDRCILLRLRWVAEIFESSISFSMPDERCGSHGGSLDSGGHEKAAIFSKNIETLSVWSQKIGSVGGLPPLLTGHIENLQRWQLSCPCLPEHPHKTLRNLRWFHALMNESGSPAEIALSRGSCSDISAFHGFSFQPPSESMILADKAYDDCPFEVSLMERGIHLMPLRKKNSKRKRIESAFSLIKKRFPAHVHAVTHQGFELKVFLFVLAYGIEKAMC